MSATFAIPGYTFASGLNHALIRRDSKSTMEFTGPAPSEVPKRLTLTLEKPNRLTIEFSYSDLEEAEKSDRVIADDGSVVVSLGSLSKKLLKLQFTGDIQHHVESRFAFDEKALFSSAEELPNRSMALLRRNVAIVRQILDSTPSDVFKGLLQGVRDFEAANASNG
jgi:hypothetical protein